MSLIEQNKQDYDLWKEGGAARTALHMAAGGILTGNVNGALASGATSLAAPHLNEFSQELGDVGNAVLNIGAGMAIGAATGGGISAVSAGGNTDWHNRQLHPNEMNWIKANAARFAEEQGITQAEAEQRLAQQAAKDIDVLWFLMTKDGTDTAASAFLSTQNNQTFVDSTGSIQQYFTAKDNEFWTPRTYAEEAYRYNEKTHFITDNLQTGVIRTPWQGFTDKATTVADYVSENPLESAKTAGTAIYEGVTDCVSAPIDCGKSFISNIWTTGSSSLTEMGSNLIGKDELAINSLYGQDMSAEMAVIPTAQAAFTALEVVGAGKVAKVIGKETVEAVTKTSLHTKQIFDEALQRGWDGRLDDYVYNPADGTFTGTGGGKLINTGQTDPISGDYIYQRIGADGKAYGNYLTVTPEGKQFKVNKPDELYSRQYNPDRPTPIESERDVGLSLPEGSRAQVSFKDGQEVPYGTLGSVRPDWCIDNICSIEVKNYDINANRDNLIINVAQQAKERAEHLPKGMVQEIKIDLRGQKYTLEDVREIKHRIEVESNYIIKSESISILGEKR